VERVLKVRRYLAIIKKIFMTSLIADLEFRMNIVLKVINDIIWYVTQAILFEVLFLLVPRIGDWTLESSRLFLGILFIVDALFSILFFDNLEKLSDRVRKGDLDFILSKPMNSQFAMSMYKMNASYIINLVIVTCWFFYHLLHSSIILDPLRILFFPVLILSSLCLVYSTRVLFCTLSVIYTRADYIMYVWFQLYRFGTRPDSIYPGAIRFVIMSVMPFALIASIPAKWLLFQASWLWFFWAIFVGFSFLYLSHLFWNFALRRYSSASS
jgi:ABC-2 type transport system permease protein